MTLEREYITELFNKPGYMEHGVSILGNEEDEKATLPNILDQLTRSSKPTFVHIIAHGILDEGNPKIRLADPDGALYQDVSARQFGIEDQTFRGVKLIFLNLCYGLARKQEDNYNFGFILVDEMEVEAVIGTSGTPCGLVAAYLSLCFWWKLWDYKVKGPAITSDNLVSRVWDALDSAKMNASNIFKALVDETLRQWTTGTDIWVLAAGIVFAVMWGVAAASAPESSGLSLLVTLLIEIEVTIILWLLLQLLNTSMASILGDFLDDVHDSLEDYTIHFSSSEETSASSSGSGGSSGTKFAALW